MKAMPKATGLFETHLTVGDLDRSVAFYRDVVGLPVALEVPERGAAFLWIGGPGEAMLGLWSLGSAPIALSLHIALTTSLRDVLGACDALRSDGVTPLSFFGDETMEPSVIGWMPAAAVYFRDPDGHLIEYLAMLDEPPRPERGIIAWSAWTSAPTPGDEAVARQRHAGRAELISELCSRRPRTRRKSWTRTSRRARCSSQSPGSRGRTSPADRRRPADRASEIKNMAVEATIPRPWDRPHARRGGNRAGARARSLDRHRRHGVRRYRQPALLSAGRVSDARDRARRVHADRRLSGGAR